MNNTLLSYIDTSHAMLNKDGSVKTDIFTKDNLHMNKKGYVIWKDVIKPILIQGENKGKSK
jgi:hypothetical protein